MARVRKPQPTLEAVFFNTPEQKVMRLLLSESTTTFTPRVISSKLKGIRGLGGAEGIFKILEDLQSLGMVDFVDNHRAVRLQDDNPTIQVLKVFSAICDLEGLKRLLEPISSKGIMHGSRAAGKASSDSSYELVVVSPTPEEVRKVASRHPLGRALELEVLTPDEYDSKGDKDQLGVVLWGTSSSW